MKIAKRIILVIALIATFSFTANAQFHFGIKAGVSINELKFNENVLNSSNRTGFTGGVMAEFTVPVIGIGCDASVMYARRSFDATYNNTTSTYNRDYINIPVNLKYKIQIPVVSKIITPFITTGPDFSILVSKKNIENAWSNKKFDTAWTVGAGVQLVSHVQIAATYGWGLSKSSSQDSNLALYGKNRCWTVTAAYIF
ncbi:MAG: PorT family protein [Muribaculaceae bacterium]|nr:PorT family protein [Muribaculaceae bacterium]